MKFVPALLLVAVSCSVFATSLTKSQSELFMKLDTDQNGYISSSEANTDKDLSKVFKTLDGDADGKLSPSEFVAYNEKQ